MASTDSPKTIRLSWESLIEYLMRFFFPFSSLVIFFEVGANTACNRYIRAAFFESVKYF